MRNDEQLRQEEKNEEKQENEKGNDLGIGKVVAGKIERRERFVVIQRLGQCDKAVLNTLGDDTGGETVKTRRERKSQEGTFFSPQKRRPSLTIEVFFVRARANVSTPLT